MEKLEDILTRFGHKIANNEAQTPATEEGPRPRRTKEVPQWIFASHFKQPPHNADALKLISSRPRPQLVAILYT